MRDLRRRIAFCGIKKIHIFFGICIGGYYVSMKGPLGKLQRFYRDQIITVMPFFKDSSNLALFPTTYLLPSSMAFMAIWEDMEKMIGGVCGGYSPRLALHGIIYACWRPGRQWLPDRSRRGSWRPPFFHLRLGFRHMLTMKMPSKSILWMKTRDVRIFSMEFNALRNFGIRVRRLAWPNAYTTTGIQYRGEIIEKKPGKTR
jgi:ribosomal protein L6P/L9E